MGRPDPELPKTEPTRPLRGERAVEVTHEAGPDSEPGDLSAAASEIDDSLLAAVAAAPGGPQQDDIELAPGALVGESFRVVERIGAGGMGVVYLAHDETLDRQVAVKLHRGVAGVDRLQREAVAMARLAHPNVITVHEVGRHERHLFVAMEYVAGGTLRAWSRTGKRPWRDILAVCMAAGRGLAAAHAAGLVHRDFKPENVLVGRDGRARVGDFGLARSLGESSDDSRPPSLRPARVRPRPPRAAADADTLPALDATMPDAPRTVGVTAPTEVGEPTVGVADSTDAGEPAPADPAPASAGSASGSGSTPVSGRDLLSDRLTMTGVMIGTPAYMSPEQFAGSGVDARADQFAFAVVTWEALYGGRPFAGKDARALRAAVDAGRVSAPPRDTEVPGAVRAVLARALASDPDDRFPSMTALLAALSAAARPRRARWLAAGLGGAAVLGLGVAWLAWPAPAGDPCASATADVAQAFPDALTTRLQSRLAAASGDRDLLDRVERRVLGARDHFRVAAVQVCRAGRVDRSLSTELFARARACLRYRARAAALVLDDVELLAADPVVYSQRVRGAPSPSACADSVALAANVQPPSDEVTEARARLVAAAADVGADRLDRAEAGVERAMAMPGAAADPAVAAMALVVRGRVALERDQVDDAARLLTDAYYAGQALDDTEVYLPALAGLLSLHGSEKQTTDIEPWVRTADAVIKKDRRRAEAGVAEVMSALSGVADRDGDSARAIALAEELVTMSERGGDPLQRAEALYTVATAMSGAGRYPEAITRFESALAVFEKVLGATHPTSALALTEYGLAVMEGPDAVLLASIAERARVALAAWPDAHSGERATALLNLGVLLSDRSEVAEQSVAALSEARDLFASLYGADHADVALAEANLAVAELKRGHATEALAAFERSLAIQEKAYGPDHFQVAATEFNIAAACLRLREFSRAAQAAARAASIYARVVPGTERHAFAHILHAKALSGLGRSHEAAVEARRAADIASHLPGSTAVVGAAVEVARADLALGRNRTAALRALAEARAAYMRFPDVFAERIAEVDAIFADAGADAGAGR